MGAKSISPVKNVLRENVRKLLDRDYPPENYPNGRGQLLAFLQDHRGWTRKNLSKLQRVVAEGSCNLDTVAQLSIAFQVQPYQLFVRDLDVADPQQIVSGKILRGIEQLKQGG